MRFEGGVGEVFHQHLTLFEISVCPLSWLCKGVILAFSQNSCFFSLAIQIIFVSLHRKIENKHLEICHKLVSFMESTSG